MRLRWKILGVLGLGVLIVVIMVLTKSKGKRVAPTPPKTAVHVIRAMPQNTRAKVVAQGLVSPAKQVVLNAELTGTIAWTANTFRPGGIFKQGDVIARIDDRDYRIALKEKLSQAKSAELALRQESERQQLAGQEWEVIAPGQAPHEQNNALALRSPQLNAAKLALEAAQSGVSRAQLNLARTTLRAPFNAFLQTKSVDVGQFVGMGAPIATLVGSDAYWITASVPVAALSMLGDHNKAIAIVQQNTGNEIIERKAQVLEVLRDVDLQTRRAKITLEIKNPNTGKMPLLVGSYVTVTLTGREINDTFKLPDVAVHERERVWVVDDKNKIHPKKITVLWQEGSDLVVTGDIAKNDRVVASPMLMPLEGQEVAETTGATP